MSLEMHRINNSYVALDDEHQIVLTPAGSEIRTRFPRLLKETLEDLETHGPDPGEAISTYSLVCSYIDFARAASKQALIGIIFHDLRHDIVFDLPASPEAHHFLDRCYRNMLFDRIGIAPSQAVPPNLNRLKDRLMSELQVLSRRQLTVVIYFSANLGSALLGLAVVTHSINLGDLAQAYCARLHCYLTGQHDSLGTGERVQYEYDPEVFDEQYCDECCVGSEYDHPVRLTSSCSVVQMLEKVQRFCGFPDE
ncbi:MAG: hypothetical protein ACYS74_01110 [Planctomycetota bacterium]|jgi:hypothetical protein